MPIIASYTWEGPLHVHKINCFAGFGGDHNLNKVNLYRVTYISGRFRKISETQNDRSKLIDVYPTFIHNKQIPDQGCDTYRRRHISISGIVYCNIMSFHNTREIPSICCNHLLLLRQTFYIDINLYVCLVARLTAGWYLALQNKYTIETQLLYFVVTRTCC